jgi:twinkle protein
MLKLKPYEIEEYLRSKGLSFRRRGSKAECKLCPFCHGGDSGDKFTFVVYLDSTGGNFKCMRGKCAVAGSFWQLASHFGDDPKSFYAASDKFKEQRNTRIAPELAPDLTYHAEPVQPNTLTETALEYLQKRGFQKEVLDEVPIWCDAKGNINFGYYHKGELCMVKVRKPSKPTKGDPKAWQAWQGGLRTLWALELCDFEKHPFLVIAFGEYDALALRQARVPNAVSVPCGDSDLEWINICFDELKKAETIFLWADNDEAGQKALPKIAARLGERKIKIVKSEYKDANEMLVFESRKTDFETAEQMVFAAVERADWYYKGDVIGFSEIEETETSFFGYKTGIDLLDKNLGGALQGRLTVHFGNTKAGKSSAINQIIAESVEQGAIACVWAGEDDLQDYKYKMQVHLAGYDGVEIRTSNAGAEYAEVRKDFKRKINEWARNRLFVVSKRSGITEDTILENFRLAFERFGCDVFVVDNLMKLVAGKDTNNLNFRQTQVVNQLSDFAKETKTHIHLVAHSNKTDNENTPPNSINEVSGAKEIVNLCDSLISWWRVPSGKSADYNGADTVCTILANRVFGLKDHEYLAYDWRVKRFGRDMPEIMKKTYSLGFADSAENGI